jgi:HSP20 family molecular chaperone IbpA
MATTTDRIPLQVNHGGQNNSNFSSSYEFRSGSNASPAKPNAYDMGPMGDETDRIKQRMREFEERCSKWRENFFTNRHEFAADIDQRVPLTPLKNPVDNQFIYSSNISHRSPGRGGAGNTSSTVTSSSSMHHTHRTTLEDTPSGGKKYKIEFEIGDFKQNELQISTHGSSTLVVKGDREMKAGLATETKTFNREITLPDYVDVARMNAYLVDSNAAADNNNVLIVEAPVLMDKYTYRRSAFDNSQSPVRVSTRVASSSGNNSRSPNKTHSTPSLLQQQQQPPSAAGTNSILRNANDVGSTATTSSSSHLHHHHHHHQHSSSSENKVSTTTTTKVVRDVSPAAVDLGPAVDLSPSHHQQHTPMSLRQSRTNLSAHQQAPELIKGYPTYDSAESCVVYKFDLSGFDQTEIQLTITVDRTLEIKASKELQDNLGNTFFLFHFRAYFGCSITSIFERVLRPMLDF